MKYVSSYIRVTIGAFISAFALRGFLMQGGLLDGGITGTSMLISTKTGISLSMLIVAINIFPLYLGMKNIGKRFLFRASYAIGVFTLILGYLETVKFSIAYSTILCSVFGGILYGIGVGLVLREGACLDGTEVIGVLISKNTALSVGQTVLCYNILLYVIAGFIVDWDTALYSLLTYMITSVVIDRVVEGFNTKKAVMIITSDGDKIIKEITEKMERTVTKISGVGAISGEKDILYVVVTKLEVQELKEILDNYQAFVIVSDVEEVIGKHYKKKINKEDLHEDIFSGSCI